tara:strand:- start:3439 stop:4401 length:963 start_codon:yes stop_codon:yes gene_type:complete
VKNSFKKTVLLGLLALLIQLPAEAYAKSWLEAIADVEARSQSLWDKGLKLGGSAHLGSAYNEIDIPRHECAILGRMLGKPELILKLEENNEPSLSESPTQDELHNLLIFAHSLSNWANVARNLIERDEDSKKKIWNLNCVGSHEIPTSAFFSVSKAAAKFRVSDSNLFILGNIELGFAEELEAALNSNPNIDRIVLGSGGGSVGEAIQAGMLIRSRGLNTTLSDNCYSACPLVFLGGVNRTIWSPYPVLGFHQMSDPDGAPIRSSHPLYSAMESYAEMMGTDANFLLASMLRASPLEMFEPHVDDLCRYKFTTWIQRICF